MVVNLVVQVVARVGRSPQNGGTGTTGQGNPGGDSSGGGGGAGAAGDATAPAPSDGHGGIGVQLPPAFRDPKSSIGAPGDLEAL